MPTSTNQKNDGRKIYKKMYEECWFQLNEDHMNIMNMQKIRREDIIDFFSYNLD